MTDLALPGSIEPAVKRPNLDKGFNPLTMILFGGILAGGLLFVAYSLYEDVDATGTQITSYVPYILLFVALLIALGFEFVNGFHDTANAVATVIYTHSLPAEAAVLWSGFFNFLGVALSSGAVAFGIISLLPVELILQVGSSAGFAMVFALLIAAIIWNLGTWWLGLPASSSHTMIGSIIGVGVANALLRGRDGTSGVDWGKAIEIGEALLFSPIVGFVLSAVLLLVMKALIRNPALYQAPKGDSPPPLWIRGLLVLTCTGVSFAHGSNDGQKGMGLIMLILIGTVPTVYALNRTMPAEPDRAIRHQLGRCGEGGRGEGRRLQRDRRSAAGGDQLRRAAPDQRRDLSLAGRADAGNLEPGYAIWFAHENPGGRFAPKAANPAAGLCSTIFQYPKFGSGAVQTVCPSLEEATHHRSDGEGYPDRPGRASNKEGESWTIIAGLSSAPIRQSCRPVRNPRKPTFLGLTPRAPSCRRAKPCGRDTMMVKPFLRAPQTPG